MGLLCVHEDQGHTKSRNATLFYYNLVTYILLCFHENAPLINHLISKQTLQNNVAYCTKNHTLQLRAYNI